MLQKTQKKGAKKGKPFLINGQLPHLTGTVKILWDDEDLALSADQKKKLLVVRKNTMSGIKTLKQEIFPLEQEIVKASLSGASSSSLETKVNKLASLRAKATMIHLKCIYETKQILNKAQLEIVE